jgi:hypothetical protein
MTEAEWLACTHPGLMREFVQQRGKFSDRKLRLFAVCCCRRIWRLIPEGAKEAVEVAERYADGLATADELAAAHTRAEAVLADIDEASGDPDHACGSAGIAASFSAVEDEYRDVYASGVPCEASHAAAFAAGPMGGAAWLSACAAEDSAQCELLRDVFGNPFRLVAADPSWLSWSGGNVGKLCRRIYDHKQFDLLSVLADALEAAGCANAEILTHCRRPDEHVRGCWVIDLLLATA